MPKNIINLIAVILLLFLSSGCAVIGTAISAGIGYGIYQATRK
ncbi:MAG TPA: hypothetical protein PL155_04465 [Candidatus Omnitrophota bacterium]|nr:hypothetical protein [Candidatus Omnitrophota bacterium]HPD84270.1 hypothetical protein [Candidatus Omnitrophota bacterium]HRZ03126.1 hypothetical protein [Candidatus Omnitrophota bacterium]